MAASIGEAHGHHDCRRARRRRNLRRVIACAHGTAAPQKCGMSHRRASTQKHVLVAFSATHSFPRESEALAYADTPCLSIRPSLCPKAAHLLNRMQTFGARQPRTAAAISLDLRHDAHDRRPGGVLFAVHARRVHLGPTIGRDVIAH